MQTFLSFSSPDEFANYFFGFEGSPYASQLLAGLSYKTKNSNEYVDVSIEEMLEAMKNNGAIMDILQDQNNYPLSIKLRNEYTVTEEIFNTYSADEGSSGSGEVLSYALFGPFMQVFFSASFTNLAVSFTYQIGESDPVYVDGNNATELYYEIMQKFENGGGFSAFANDIPIKYTNIRYGNIYICEGEGIDIESIESSTFSYNTNITKVTISEGITTINETFDGCSNLIELSIPSTLKKIALNAFQGCDNLEFKNYDNGLYLGNSDNPYVLLVSVDKSQGEITSFNVNENCKVIAPNAKIPAGTLRRINLPSSLTSIGQNAIAEPTDGADIYYNGTIEQWVNIIFEPRWHSSQKLNLFLNNTLLENIDINSNINDCAFMEINSIKNVNIGENVSYIGEYAFTACNNLENVSFAENSLLTSIELYAFGGTNLQSVDIPEGVTEIGVAGFATCPNLSNINLPSTLKTIGDGAFIECKNLSVVNFAENSQLQTICSQAFRGCNSLTNISLPASLKTIDTLAFAECEKLAVINFAKNSQLQTINYQAFSMTGITEIVFPASVEHIGTYAFAFTLLQKVSFEQGSKLYYLGDYPFLLCSELTELTLPSSLTQIVGGVVLPYTFETNLSYNKYDNGYYLGNNENPYMILCSVIDRNISDIDIHYNCKFIAAYAFQDCVNLIELTIPSSVMQISYLAFRDCTNLKTVLFEDDSQMTSIDYGIFGNGYFYPIFQSVIPEIPEKVYIDQNLNIESIIFGDNSHLQSIAENAFEGLDTLLEIDFGNNSQLKTIVDNLFVDCVNLKNITIPEGVTSIGSSAFRDCSNLTEITLPSTLQTIGDWAFSNCSSLTSVTIESEDIYRVATGINYNHAGNLLYNATTVKVLTSIVEANDNSYLEDTANFTTSVDGEYTVFTKVS